MARLWIRRISRGAIALAFVVPIGALLWAVWWLWLRLTPQWDPRTSMAIVIVALPLLAAVWWLWWRLPQRHGRND